MDYLCNVNLDRPFYGKYQQYFIFIERIDCMQSLKLDRSSSNSTILSYTTETILPVFGYVPQSLQGCCAPLQFWLETSSTKVNQHLAYGLFLL